jgi:hypothetical protein
VKKITHETWWSIGIGVALVLVTIAAGIQSARTQQSTPTLASDSSEPDGARALWLWLQALGYTASSETSATFALPERASIALILEPSSAIADDEWETLDTWIDDGGTLVIAGDQWGSALASRHFDFDLTYLITTVPTLTAQSPLWLSPPVTVPVAVNTHAYFETQRADFVSHLAVGSQPVVVSFTQGEGRVILSAAPFPFTNAGLKVAGNPEFVLNVVAPVFRDGLVWFNEWHHGQRATTSDAIGPDQWLRSTPTGHALLYTVAVLYLALIARGRLFGRPVPLPNHISRRAPLEYITAIANLRRQAGYRTAELRYYYDTLKRQLGRRYRLSPDLPDDAYVEQLAAYDPNLDSQALLHLLSELRRPDVSESDMVRLANEASKWLKE